MPDDLPCCQLPLLEHATTCAGYLLDYARWARHAADVRYAPCDGCRRLLAWPQATDSADFAFRFERLLWTGRSGEVFAAIVGDLDFEELRRLVY